MRVTIEQAAARLREQDDVLILSHGHPDGDTLGCAFALCRALRGLHKRARVACGDEIPQKYAYLWQGLAEQDFEPRFFVAVDVADVKLLGKAFAAQYGGRIDLCIDHHGSHVDYARETLVDARAAAAAEMIRQVVAALDVPVDAGIADCIYTGLSTDTGCFRYSNVTARTHRIAAEMIEAGARAGEINRVMFETKTRTYARLERLALEGLQLYFGDRCAVLALTQEMFRQSGSDESECDAIASLPRQIEGVLVGATLREKPDGSFKVSLRTHEPIDAAALCARLGGGGHARAAGCELNGPLDQAREKLLREIEAVLEDV